MNSLLSFESLFFFSNYINYTTFFGKSQKIWKFFLFFYVKISEKVKAIMKASNIL